MTIVHIYSIEKFHISFSLNVVCMQGVVTPIRTVVTAKTGVKKWSTGQGVFLPLVKGPRTTL